MAPREQAVRVVTLSGRRLAATLVLAISVREGWRENQAAEPDRRATRARGGRR
jgi:hypothetical protein